MILKVMLMFLFGTACLIYHAHGASIDESLPKLSALKNKAIAEEIPILRRNGLPGLAPFISNFIQKGTNIFYRPQISMSATNSESPDADNENNNEDTLIELSELTTDGLPTKILIGKPKELYQVPQTRLIPIDTSARQKMNIFNPAEDIIGHSPLDIPQLPELITIARPKIQQYLEQPYQMAHLMNMRMNDRINLRPAGNPLLSSYSRQPIRKTADFESSPIFVEELRPQPVEPSFEEVITIKGDIPPPPEIPILSLPDNVKANGPIPLSYETVIGFQSSEIVQPPEPLFDTLGFTHAVPSSIVIEQSRQPEPSIEKVITINSEDIPPPPEIPTFTVPYPIPMPFEIQPSIVAQPPEPLLPSAPLDILVEEPMPKPIQEVLIVNTGNIPPISEISAHVSGQKILNTDEKFQSLEIAQPSELFKLPLPAISIDIPSNEPVEDIIVMNPINIPPPPELPPLPEFSTNLIISEPFQTETEKVVEVTPVQIPQPPEILAIPVPANPINVFVEQPSIDIDILKPINVPQPPEVIQPLPLPTPIEIIQEPIAIPLPDPIEQVIPVRPIEIPQPSELTIPGVPVEIIVEQPNEEIIPSKIPPPPELSSLHLSELTSSILVEKPIDHLSMPVLPPISVDISIPLLLPETPESISDHIKPLEITPISPALPVLTEESVEVTVPCIPLLSNIPPFIPIQIPKLPDLPPLTPPEPLINVVVNESGNEFEIEHDFTPLNIPPAPELPPFEMPAIPEPILVEKPVPMAPQTPVLEIHEYVHKPLELPQPPLPPLKPISSILIDRPIDAISYPQMPVIPHIPIPSAPLLPPFHTIFNAPQMPFVPILPAKPIIKPQLPTYSFPTFSLPSIVLEEIPAPHKVPQFSLSKMIKEKVDKIKSYFLPSTTKHPSPLAILCAENIVRDRVLPNIAGTEKGSKMIQLLPAQI